MDLQQLLQSITPDIYQNLKRAVELGRWPDGNKVSKEQRELCLQAVIAWETKHLPATERTGYIPPKPGGACATDSHDHGNDETPLKWH